MGLTSGVMALAINPGVKNRGAIGQELDIVLLSVERPAHDAIRRATIDEGLQCGDSLLRLFGMTTAGLVYPRISSGRRRALDWTWGTTAAMRDFVFMAASG